MIGHSQTIIYGMEKVKQKELLIEIMNKDAELGLYKMTDLEYAKGIRKQINIINELIKEAEANELDIVVWQYGTEFDHSLHVKITKTVEL
jgi:hypothetical protein